MLTAKLRTTFLSVLPFCSLYVVQITILSGHQHPMIQCSVDYSGFNELLPDCKLNFRSPVVVPQISTEMTIFIYGYSAICY